MPPARRSKFEPSCLVLLARTGGDDGRRLKRRSDLDQFGPGAHRFVATKALSEEVVYPERPLRQDQFTAGGTIALRDNRVVCSACFRSWRTKDSREVTRPIRRLFG